MAIETFALGGRLYDTTNVGYRTDSNGAFVFETSDPGNGNGGHEYGADLEPEGQKGAALLRVLGAG